MSSPRSPARSNKDRKTRRKDSPKRLERPVYANQDPEHVKTIGKRKKVLSLHTSGTIARGYKHEIDGWTKARLYMMHEGRKVVFITLYYIITLYIILFKYYTYAADPKYAVTRIVFQHALPFARAGAGVILFNSSLILFPVCRSLISKCRASFLGSVIPFDKNIIFHKFVGAHIVIFTILHISAHTFDFRYLSLIGSLGLGFAPMGSAESLWLSLLPAYTGHLALLCLFLMVTSSVKKVRTANFEIFWYTHHLFTVFLLAMILHGAGCVVETLTNTQCVMFTEYWKWSILGMLCYSFERIISRSLLRARRPVNIQKIIVHPSHVVEIQWIPLYRKQMRTAIPGQYIFLNCPAVGGYQFHPFTLTSCPEDGYMSIHFREAGDFTKRLSKLLIDSTAESHGLTKSLPPIYIDGPFGAAAEDAFKYKTCIFVGAGIGVTPFASLLKSIFYQVEMGTCQVERVKFFWICRDTTAFEWFNDLLSSLEQQNGKVHLEHHIYLTRFRDSIIPKMILDGVDDGNCPITGLESKTNFGRPNWDSIFANTATENPTENVGVFVCGPKPLTGLLKKNCLLYSHYQNTSTVFHFNKENFG